MERFERKRIRTLLASFFGAVFAPVLWPAALIESETIQTNGSPGVSRSFFICHCTWGQQKIMPA